ncbi:hypothetical protein NEOC95_000631, partial [Neochlamydia sp. AcF95]|nr:hypothetical protein [Neochlamydia sp. AcF95]
PPYLNLEKGCLQFSIAATYGVRLNGIIYNFLWSTKAIYRPRKQKNIQCMVGF